MLKRFFITVLGVITGFWICIGLMFIVGIAAVGYIAAFQDTETVSIGKHSILYLDLSGELTERQVVPSLIDDINGSSSKGMSLNTAVAAIRAAADDDDIDGIFIEANGMLAGVASRMELVQALQNFKNSDKWIVGYGDSFSQGDYYLSSIADELYVNPIGGVDVHGLASTTYFYKGLLEKVGVKVQVVKVGTYKSAVEPYILSGMSPANREQQELYIGQIWNCLASGIAEARETDVASVNQWADSLILTEAADSYISRNIVNATAYRHEVISKLKEKTKVDEKDDLKLVTPSQYADAGRLLHTSKSNNNIAVLYAVGEISDSGKDGIVGPKMVSEIESLIDDESNQGLVLRVNSPGGSAFASEQIWEALQRYKKTGRPMYVSMSDYAASGGYYISCGADRIYAQPTTLTGSIGIFGVIPCVEDFMEDKLGVTQESVMTNPNANFISLTKAMTPDQMRCMQNEVNRGYETFVSRCAQGRGMSTDSIKAIAEGRVWDGMTAMSIGLVDRLGNLDDAISDMANELGFTKKYTVKEYPVLKLSFWDRLDELQNTGVISAKMVSGMLGESYMLYKKVEDIKSMAPLQARMDDVVIN